MLSANNSTLKLGLPTGSLQSQTVEFMRKAGWNIHLSSRSYTPSVDDPELSLRLLRAQEIARYVDHGFLDAGITGKDWVAENGVDVHVVCDLPYSKATSMPTRWVLVVPEKSPIHTVQDLQGKRIATEAIGLTKRFLESQNVEAEIEFSWGATEVKVPELVDAIVDITETGSSLIANKLRIVATLMTSYPQLIAQHAAWADPWKRGKLENLALLLQGALAARDKVGLKMNVPESALDSVLASLPALRMPTVSRLANSDWNAVETVTEEHVVRDLVPRLKALGVEGIIEFPLNKVIR